MAARSKPSGAEILRQRPGSLLLLSVKVARAFVVEVPRGVKTQVVGASLSRLIARLSLSGTSTLRLRELLIAESLSH